MKKTIGLILIFLHVSISNCQNRDNDFPVLIGPYLGQQPPGDTAKAFLPEIFKNTHSTPVFSPDGKQVYWRCMDQKSLLYIEEIDGIWCKPKSVSFSSLFYKQDVPFFSYNGDRLYFITTKSQHFYHLWSNEAIWCVEKDDERWSSPIMVSKELNKIFTHWQFSVAANGNIYFNGSEDKNHDIWFIYKSEFKNGKYSKPEKLLEPFCISKGESTYLFPFIAPDESYLIFCKNVNGNRDLFISFRRKNNTWTDGINMGEKINSKGIELCPIVTLDNKYLFYMRRDCVMWVSAKIIDDLRTKFIDN